MRQWAVGLFLAGFIPYFLPTAWGQNLEYAGSTFWTGVYDVKLEGQYAYCAYVNGLAIYNVSDPANPVRVSQAFLPGEGTRLAISGNYAYVTDGFAGLQIVDISNLQDPISIGSYQAEGSLNDVFLQGQYAFITQDNAAESTLFMILDVSFPSNPQLVGSGRASDMVRGSSICVSGDHAFVGNYTGELYIYDINDPRHPLLVSDTLIDVPGSGSHGLSGISVSGNYAYIVASRGFYVVDISDLSSPAIICQWGHESFNDISKEGNHAYIVGDNRMYALDISDPYNPDMLSFVNTNRSTGAGLDVSGGTACVAAEEFLLTYDVSNPDTIIEEGEIGFGNLLRSPDDITVSGNYVFSPHRGLLRVVDVSDRSNPNYIAGCVIPIDANKIFIAGNYAYLTGSDTGLVIVNISDPLAPFEAGVYMPQSSGTLHIFVQGNYAFLSTGLGLEILNVADPPHPVLTGRYWRLGNAFAQGSYVYMVTRPAQEFQVIDVSDPVNPSLVGSIPSPSGGPPFVVGDYAYLKMITGISVIDVSDPAAPAFVAACTTRANLYDIYVAGHYIYAAAMRIYDGTGGVDVINVSNPTSPELTTSLVLAGFSHNIYVDDNYCYLTTDYSMVILTALATGIDNRDLMPGIFALSQNFPNPFNARTTISYSLLQAGRVHLEIFNIVGEKVAELLDGIKPAGPHRTVWDAGGIPSGVYFARLESGGKSQTIKMVVLK